MLKPGEITVHSIICNEPFVYYSIKSVYNYVDKILLYDTGSYDQFTLSDIHVLLNEDKDCKIIFKQIEIDVCEADVDYEHLDEILKKNKDKKGKGAARQQQIDDTETEFFMVLDGDEIYYDESIKKIRLEIVPNFSKEKICGFTPLTWYANINQVFSCRCKYTGRLFRTDAVSIVNRVPDEMHINKCTGKMINRNDPESFIMDIRPFAHFSSYVKPWRRSLRNFKKYETNDLPEVMKLSPFYMYRYQMYLDLKGESE
jgi:glycosyltransferase involved in cell wall biosynthesis